MSHEMSNQKYIYASCKNWHYPYFERLKQAQEDLWYWASTPEELHSIIEKIKPRYVFFVHWSWQVPESIWNRYECVCFHMSDVPYGRGGSPLQNLIIEGKKTTKLSALQMVAELDAGPVYVKRDLDLKGRAQQVYLRAAELTIEVMLWMIVNNPVPIPQTGKVTLFKRRKPEQSLLPKSNIPVDIYDFIRMLDADGYPYAYLLHGNFRLEFQKARKEGQVVMATVRITMNSQGE